MIQCDDCSDALVTAGYLLGAMAVLQCHTVAVGAVVRGK
jgi:hypothetical protein